MHSGDLMEVSLPYIDRNDCKNMIAELRKNPRFHVDENISLTENIICAGNDVKRTGDVCRGDAEGALVMFAENRWIQTGIVSFGFGRCDYGLYGFYTNVGQFFDWLKEISSFDQEYV